ncbi:hypothetical protein HPB47_018748, partial [Ixodes persulcatus]
MSDANMDLFYSCNRVTLPPIVVEKFDETGRMFPGKTQAQITRMLCQTVDDNSDIIIEEFIEDF